MLTSFGSMRNQSLPSVAEMEPIRRQIFPTEFHRQFLKLVESGNRLTDVEHQDIAAFQLAMLDLFGLLAGTTPHSVTRKCKVYLHPPSAFQRQMTHCQNWISSNLDPPYRG